MKYSLFYAWQSEEKENKELIRNALKKAKRKVKEMYGIEIDIIDSPTKGDSGSPDIYRKIIERISSADIFLGEVTAVYTNKTKGRYISNSNVMFEVGYALATLGEEQCILLSDIEKSDISKLSFDINHKRISPYKYSEGYKILTNNLCDYIFKATETVSRKKYLLQFIFNEILSDLEIIYNNFMRLCYDYEQKIPFSFIIEKEKLKEIIKNNEYCLFQLFKDNERIIGNIKNQIKQLCYVNYTDRHLLYKLARLAEGIEYINLINKRSNYCFFEKIDKIDSDHYYAIQYTKDFAINDLSNYDRFNNNFIFKKGAGLLSYGEINYNINMPYIVVDIIENTEQLLQTLKAFEVPVTSVAGRNLDLYYDVPFFIINDNDYICNLVDVIIEFDCFIKELLPTLGIKMNDNLYNSGKIEYPGYIINFE